MSPIDQIRKGYAAGGEAELINVPGYPLMVSAVDYNRLRASHDAAVQRAAELEKQVEAVTHLANAAMRGAAEMQERCARIAEADAPDYRGAEIAAAIRAIKE